jgi:hypothetical protein
MAGWDVWGPLMGGAQLNREGRVEPACWATCGCWLLCHWKKRMVRISGASDLGNCHRHVWGRGLLSGPDATSTHAGHVPVLEGQMEGRECSIVFHNADKQ